MSTIPSNALDRLAAALDDGLVRNLLSAGMNVMRINCAHDGPEEWKAMIAHLRQAELELGLTCRVQADLPGPKLRTGPIAPLARALKLRPERDALGRLVRPARAWLTPSTDPETAPAELSTSIRVAGGLLAEAQEGDLVAVTDARGRRRALRVVEARGRSRVVETARTIYLIEGATLRLRRGSANLPAEGRAEGLAELVEPIRLRTGDLLALTRADHPGHPAHRDDALGTFEPARIHCTLPEAFDSVRAGDRVRDWRRPVQRGDREPIVPAWLGPSVFDLFVRAKAENDKYARHLRSSAGIAVFVSQRDDRDHWVRAGRACQRFALQSTALGLKHAFVNQPVEVASLRPELATLVGMPGRRPDIVMRFGYGPTLPFLARRRHQEVQRDLERPS